MRKDPKKRDGDCTVVNFGDPVALSQLEKDLVTGSEPHLFVVGNVFEQIRIHVHYYAP